MKISKKMEDALNKQINAELYSAYLYLEMKARFDNMNLKGFANWMHVQALEEMSHAMKFYDYVFERGGSVTMDKIDKPSLNAKTALAIFGEVYSHEVKVTGLINNLVAIAAGEKDHASSSVLQWFIDEQVEEEASADDIVQKLKLVGDSPEGVMFLDKELSARQFVPIAKGG